MKESITPITFGLIALTVLVSWKGFLDRGFCDRHLFSIREILAGKEYRRLITSAFLHADWGHLFLNMFSLYLFGSHLELVLGGWEFLAIYFAAVLGGDFLALWIHRNHEYRAYGASGGVCGVIFSFVLLAPGAGLSMFFLPFAMPGWLYAALFLIGSFFALKSQAGNIGHDAHIGGAILGLWTTAAFEPWAVRESLNVFLLLSGIAGLLFLYLVKNPLFLPLSSFQLEFRRQPNVPKPRKRSEPLEVDAILEKIAQQGIQTLTDEEKKLLNSVSEKYQRRADSKKPESDLII